MCDWHGNELDMEIGDHKERWGLWGCRGSWEWNCFFKVTNFFKFAVAKKEYMKYALATLRPPFEILIRPRPSLVWTCYRYFWSLQFILRHCNQAIFSARYGLLDVDAQQQQFGLSRLAWRGSAHLAASAALRLLSQSFILLVSVQIQSIILRSVLLYHFLIFVNNLVWLSQRLAFCPSWDFEIWRNSRYVLPNRHPW